MLPLISIPKAKKRLANNIRAKRLSMDLTQQGLSERSGVPLSTLRHFEQRGSISLEAFLKLLAVVGGMEELIEATKISPREFSSIDDVLKTTVKKDRQRGRRK